MWGWPRNLIRVAGPSVRLLQEALILWINLGRLAPEILICRPQILAQWHPPHLQIQVPCKCIRPWVKPSMVKEDGLVPEGQWSTWLKQALINQVYSILHVRLYSHDMTEARSTFQVDIWLPIKLFCKVVKCSTKLEWIGLTREMQIPWLMSSWLPTPQVQLQQLRLRWALAMEISSINANSNITSLPILDLALAPTEVPSS
jgi:hypothetical protein